MSFFYPVFLSGVIFFSSGAVFSPAQTGSGSRYEDAPAQVITVVGRPMSDGYLQPLYATSVFDDIAKNMGERRAVVSTQRDSIPKIASRAYLLGDVQSGEILLSEHEQEQLAIGSLTKLMTAVVAMEHFSLDDEVVISSSATGMEGAKIKFFVGERVLLSDLLISTLVRSGNDGAYAIAEHAPLGQEQFIEWMNEKAHQLGMNSSHFSNSMGFDDPKNYATAHDLFLLSRYLLDTKPFLKDAVARESYEFTSLTGKYHRVESTNELFKSFLPIKGMKTGTTADAGASFIGLLENPKGGNLIGIVLASPDRFQETKTLFWWAIEHSL